jgi:hypothetical protein
VRSLFALVCALLLCCALMRVLLPSLPRFYCNQLCKTWETPSCGDSSQSDFSIRKIYVALNFDLWITWEGLSSTLDQRMSLHRGVGIGQTIVKLLCILSIYFLRLLSSWVLYSLAILLLSLILILKEQSSEEFFLGLTFSHALSTSKFFLPLSWLDHLSPSYAHRVPHNQWPSYTLLVMSIIHSHLSIGTITLDQLCWTI